MVWNLSCPAVSQICNFIFFPWSSTVLILKSIPIVEINVVLKVSSENLKKISSNPKTAVVMLMKYVVEKKYVDEKFSVCWWSNQHTISNFFTDIHENGCSKIEYLPEQHTSFADSWITNKQKFKQKIFTVVLIDSKFGIFC